MSFLLGIIYLSFISLGLPDTKCGNGWIENRLDIRTKTKIKHCIMEMWCFYML